MFELLFHIGAQHDLGRMAMAAIVCFCASFTAFRLFSQMRAATGMVRAAWLLLTGLVAGCGAWSTHFLAMLAFEPGLKMGYAPDGTLYSLMVAVAFMIGGFAVAAAGPVGSREHSAAAGFVLGFGVAAMHYLGVSTVVIAGHIAWSPALVALSIALCVMSFALALHAGRDAASLPRQLIGGGVMTLAVCILHFTGMAAATLTPDPSAIVPDSLLSGDVMRLAVTAMSALTILGGLGVALIEQHLTAAALGRMRRLADAAFEGLVVVKGGRIQDANTAFCEMVRCPLEALIGRRLDGAMLTYDALRDGADGGREALLQPADGEAEIPVAVFARVLDAEPVAGGDVTVLAIRDLRERRAAEEKIRYLAEHDGLTGLPNRNAMLLRLRAALERARNAGESLALVCIDLDRFKEANDLHGHMAGDALLVEAARRLRDSICAPSFVARLGGDEFVVVQQGLDQPAAAAALASEIIESLAAPMTWQGQAVPMGASLGVALFPDDGAEPEALLANADMALYRAKDQGRGGYCFFKREMDQAVRERRALARDLRRGLEADELVVFYQPLARAASPDLQAGVCGFEALARWRHPTLGMMSPVDFIPLAEESGLIGALGEQVLRAACAEAAGWPSPHRIAVNLSPLQLKDPGLPTLVHSVLLESGLSPARLELEVTESALFEDYQRALDTLRRLKGLGVRIAMDDFGTGFSSLSTLQSFPFDKIKIDKSFVEQINREGRATAIVRAVLGLGRSLGIPVVAEGVETADQIAFLRAEGCDELQGYAIGRPSPSDSIGCWTGAPPLASKRLPSRERGGAKAA